MTHSSSTAPGASDAQSKDGNGPLSLDALFSAELSGGEQAGPAKNDEESTVAAPHHRDGTTSSPEDFATPASSDSPEDPEDVDHEEDRAVGCLVLVHIRLLQSPGPTESAH